MLLVGHAAAQADDETGLFFLKALQRAHVAEHPLLGVLVGAVVTGVIQSSAASVGILQTLAATGQISYGVAIPIIMGQNIGTCVTALISSVGASKTAKRAALIHLYFNIIGSFVLLGAIYAVRYTIGIPVWAT